MKDGKKNRKRKPNDWSDIPVADCEKIVLPKNPTLDKAIAALLAVLLKDGSNGLNSMPLEFQEVVNASRQTQQRWTDEKALVFDLLEAKYQYKGEGQEPFGSACEMLAHRERITDPVLLELVDKTVKQNGSGYLKQGAHRIAKLMRQAYDLPGFNSNEDVVKRVGRVVHTWIKSHGETFRDSEYSLETFLTNPYPAPNPKDPKYIWNLKLLQQDQKCHEESTAVIKKLLEDLRRNPGRNPFKDQALFEDFSLGQYAFHLWQKRRSMGSYSTSHIVREIEWWMEVEEAERQARASLPEEFERAPQTEFAQGRALLVRTNNRRVLGWTWRHVQSENWRYQKGKKKGQGRPYQVIVIRADKRDPRHRKVGVFASDLNVDLRLLSAVLYTLEGHVHVKDSNGYFSGHWYHQMGDGKKSQANFLMNGSPDRKTPATWIKDQLLMELIETLVLKTRTWNEDQCREVVRELAKTQPPNRPGGAVNEELLFELLAEGLNGKTKERLGRRPFDPDLMTRILAGERVEFTPTA